LQSFRKNVKLGSAWRNKCTVIILSTFPSGRKNEVIEMPYRYLNKPPIMKPNIVLDYAKHMGGVDCNDYYTASYQFMGTKKRYRKMFF
jgi:hypothetical protein